MAPVWISVFLAASALATVSANAGSAVINGCQNGTTTVFGNSYFNLFCYGLTVADGVFHWTLSTENGTEVPLGTCHDVNNCTRLTTTIPLSLTRPTSSWSRLYTYSALSLSGNITCTVSTKSIVGTDTCRLNVNGVRAYSNALNVLDGNRLSAYVDLVGTGRSRVKVTVSPASGEIIVLGVCTKGQSLCTSLTDNIEIYAGSFYLTISSQKELERRVAGRVSISVSFGSKQETAHFMINLYSPPRAENCSVDVHQHNWTAVFSCDVSHAFSSTGVYQVRLLECTPSFFDHNNLNNIRTADSSSELKRHEDRSFLPNMRSYFNTTDNKTYYGGRLEYSWRLSPDFKLASLLLCTRPENNYCVFPTPWFIRLPNVSRPGALWHNCSQVSYIPEKEAITCTCRMGSVGSPAGRLLWLLDNQVWASGHYGVTQLSLSTPTMTRQQTARQATCRLDWIEAQEAHLPLNIAYGPDKVDVQVYMNINGSRLTAECEVRGLNPRTADMVQWAGPCQGQRGFTCTLDPTGVMGKTVTCRVTNAANNGHSASADKVIVTDFIRESSDSDSDRWKWSAIGGGVVLAVGVVVTLLVVMVICVYRRGHLCFAPQPGGREETTTTDQHLYETLKPTDSNTAGGERLPQTAERDSSIYENSGFSGVAENHM